MLIEEQTRLAYSPNAALLATWKATEKTQFTVMARYVNLAIPTAKEGATKNYVNIAGVSLGWKRTLTSTVSVLPEIGTYWYDGQLGGVPKKGPGFQYGVMIATTI